MDKEYFKIIISCNKVGIGHDTLEEFNNNLFYSTSKEHCLLGKSTLQGLILDIGWFTFWDKRNLYKLIFEAPWWCSGPVHL